jgi:hypothetical protein
MATSDSLHFLIDQMSKDFGLVNDTLALVGLFYIGKLSCNLISSSVEALRTYLLPRIFSNEKWLKNLGNWAIVTGKLVLPFGTPFGSRTIPLYS